LWTLRGCLLNLTWFSSRFFRIASIASHHS
jgi:hypothetical protein